MKIQSLLLVLISGSNYECSTRPNTGIEASVDHTSTAKHPLAKIAKDVGSAAQFLALLLLFVLWSMALMSVVL